MTWCQDCGCIFFEEAQDDPIECPKCGGENCSRTNEDQESDSKIYERENPR